VFRSPFGRGDTLVTSASQPLANLTPHHRDLIHPYFRLKANALAENESLRDKFPHTLTRRRRAFTFVCF
jgi:hypothetical protein